MDDIEFLRKKYIDKKLLFIDSSNNVCNSYISNSNDEMKAAKIMLKQELLIQSIGHSYYSMYLLVQALLYKCGIKCEDHNASIIILNEVFGIENKEIKIVKKERIEAQYYTSKEISFELTKEILDSAENFTVELKEFIDSLNNKQIESFQKLLKEVLL